MSEDISKSNVVDLGAVFAQRKQQLLVAEAALGLMMALQIPPEEVAKPDTSYDLTVRLWRGADGKFRVQQYACDEVMA